ncbi:MAG: hypothetical protein JWM95_1178 [Gemmatimonadetes bacterium]|nr:hypothetical protein [Gemmatimonadota bacterium]
MRQNILSILALILAAHSAAAQRGGISALPDSTIARIDRAFAVVGGAEAPGCAIGMARDGKVVLTRGYGLANLEQSSPNMPETIFESGSVAKQFTAAATVLLAQDGKLGLDDDIRKYLPEMHDFGKKITIRNLLTHTSGLRDWYELADLEGAPAGLHVHSPASILEIASRQRTLNFEPGAEYLYSNTGYILASVIVERVSGKPFAAFSKERLFAPLNMTHTEWRDDFTKVVKGRATAYTRTARTGWRQDMPFTNVIGSGGLLTTVDDWMVWNAFLDNPAALPSGPALVQSLTTQMVLNNGKRIPYALGISVSSREGMKEISHSGSTGGYRTWLARYPDQRVSIAVMCNAGDGANPTALAQTSLLAVLGRAPNVAVAPVRVRMPVESLRLYEATFVGPTPEGIARFVVRDTVLVQTMPGNRTLVPVGDHRFRAGAAELLFDVRGGKVERMRQLSGMDTTTYVLTKASAPTRAELAAFAGWYTSNELKARLEVVVRDSGLVIKRGAADSLVLRPTIPDTFTSSGGTVQFARDSKGRVDALGIWAGRVRNIRFVRERSSK